MTGASERHKFTALFEQAPQDFKTEFAQEVLFVNVLRARFFAPIIAALNAVLFFGFDVYFALNGFWEQNIGYAYWAGLHGVFALTLFTVWIILSTQPLSSPSDLRPIHRAVFTFYVAFILCGCMAITLVDQQITGAITIYILGIAGLTAAHFLSLRASLWSYATNHVAFCVLLPLVQKNGITVFAHIVGATIITLLMWFLSRLLFSFKLQEFLNRKTIEQQTINIQRINQDMRDANERLSDTNKRLLAANASLAEANRLKTELLNIALNDLKNPLASLSHFVDMLIDNDKPEHQPQFLRLIKDITTRMAHTIDELLNVKAIESGALKLNRRPVDMCSMLTLMLSRHEPHAKQKEQSIVLEHLDSCMMRVDEDRIYEVIDHLISNAIKYTPNGKSIFIRLEKIAHIDHPIARFSVRDEGQGLTEDDKQKLFGKFQKLSAMPTGGERSTGLGLSIVKQLVELHGGRVWAESEGKGKGATFFVELPLLPTVEKELQSN